MGEKQYTTEVGHYLIIRITESINLYIAEVTKSSPLRLKLKEIGPLSNLKNGDFIIQEENSAQLQKDHRESTIVFMENMSKRNTRVFSGLESLGVTNNKFHEMFFD